MMCSSRLAHTLTAPTAAALPGYPVSHEGGLA